MMREPAISYERFVCSLRDPHYCDVCAMCTGWWFINALQCVVPL